MVGSNLDQMHAAATKYLLTMRVLVEEDKGDDTNSSEVFALAVHMLSTAEIRLATQE